MGERGERGLLSSWQGILTYFPCSFYCSSPFFGLKSPAIEAMTKRTPRDCVAQSFPSTPWARRGASYGARCRHRAGPGASSGSSLGTHATSCWSRKVSGAQFAHRTLEMVRDTVTGRYHAFSPCGDSHSLLPRTGAAEGLKTPAFVSL